MLIIMCFISRRSLTYRVIWTGKNCMTFITRLDIHVNGLNSYDLFNLQSPTPAQSSNYSFADLQPIKRDIAKTILTLPLIRQQAIREKYSCQRFLKTAKHTALASSVLKAIADTSQWERIRKICSLRTYYRKLTIFLFLTAKMYKFFCTRTLNIVFQDYVYIHMCTCIRTHLLFYFKTTCMYSTNTPLWSELPAWVR